MAISGAAVIKGNVIRRKGNKTSRSLPFLPLPDVLFKKPTAACNLVTDIYADICWYRQCSDCSGGDGCQQLTSFEFILSHHLHVWFFPFLREHWKMLMGHNAYVPQKP